MKKYFRKQSYRRRFYRNPKCMGILREWSAYETDFRQERNIGKIRFKRGKGYVVTDWDDIPIKDWKRQSWKYIRQNQYRTENDKLYQCRKCSKWVIYSELRLCWIGHNWGRGKTETIKICQKCRERGKYLAEMSGSINRMYNYKELE